MFSSGVEELINRIPKEIAFNRIKKVDMEEPKDVEI